MLYLNVDDDENEYANYIIFIWDHERACQIVSLMKKPQQCWFDDGLGLKFVYSWCFL